MSKPQSVLVTGANGFVGSRLVEALQEMPNFRVLSAVRQLTDRDIGNTQKFAIGNIGAETNWRPALSGVDVVVHVAARVNVFSNVGLNGMSEYRSVNVVGTRTLAQQAAEQGVRRFIFISSIRVNGSISACPFNETDVPSPADPYAISKYEAEKELIGIGASTGMEVVVIRPPLVYGQHAQGNFGKLVRLVGSGLPLPFGAVNNRRSLIGLDNLVDFVVTCINHPAAGNEVFLISDAEDLSTTELLGKIAKASGGSVVLLPVPVPVMRFFAKILGKKAVANKIFGSLQIDASKAHDLLGWQPPLSVEEGLRRCFFLEGKH